MAKVKTTALDALTNKDRNVPTPFIMGRKLKAKNDSCQV